MTHRQLHICETARDAMQGMATWIPSTDKVKYINTLLRCGFDTVDCGSFVSAQVIPQMADSNEVIGQLNFPDERPEIMALVVNEKGVEKALQNGNINCLSYPFSVSPTFLKRNLNTDPKRALLTLERMRAMTHNQPIDWVVYLSMGLGNPYGDDWSMALVTDMAGQLIGKGFRRLPLSDILGQSKPETIFRTYETLLSSFPDVDFGLHLHVKPSEAWIKLEAAWQAGVRSYETVAGGRGGCPTAADEMVGNLSSRTLYEFIVSKNIAHHLKIEKIAEAEAISAGFNL